MEYWGRSCLLNWSDTVQLAFNELGPNEHPASNELGKSPVFFSSLTLLKSFLSNELVFNPTSDPTNQISNVIGNLVWGIQCWLTKNIKKSNYCAQCSTLEHNKYILNSFVYLVVMGGGGGCREEWGGVERSGGKGLAWDWRGVLGSGCTHTMQWFEFGYFPWKNWSFSSNEPRIQRTFFNGRPSSLDPSCAVYIYYIYQQENKFKM